MDIAGEGKEGGDGQKKHDAEPCIDTASAGKFEVMLDDGDKNFHSWMVLLLGTSSARWVAMIAPPPRFV